MQVDEYSALPHGSRQPQVIREGSLVLMDDGGSLILCRGRRQRR
jgi:Xaa-Pro aminopeptidase